MQYVQIPVPDFNFADVIKDRAKETANQSLSIFSLALIACNIKGDKQNIFDELEKEFNKFYSNSDKLIFVNELLLELIEVQRQSRLPQNGLMSMRISLTGIIAENEDFNGLLYEIRYHLYQLLGSIGYNFDANAFSNEEVEDLNSKVDAILAELNKIQLGQEIIFDEINELKEDFKSLKSDFLLGKKRWYQRAAGIVVSYAGTKGADELYEILKPFLKDFFVNTAPHLIDKL